MARRFACSPVAARKVRVSCSNISIAWRASASSRSWRATTRSFACASLRSAAFSSTSAWARSAPDLALELSGVRLLLAEVAADRGERRLLLLRALAQLVVVRAQAAELVLELEVLALEAADLLRQRAVALTLAGEHRLGFEKLRLELRKLGREGRDRLEQLGEIVLEARDVVKALRHMADAGTDELVLHADGAEREARVGVPSPLVVVAVAVQVLRPAGHVRIPLIPRLKMSFQQAP